jgi:assimilatory nitrate reductase catalytic subunit
VRLTATGNDGARKLDLTDWLDLDYDALLPRQWGSAQPFADGTFQTANNKARFVPTHYQATALAGLTLNTGRIRDQWHTMTRTGLVPKLFGHRAEPHVEISSHDANRLGIKAASLVEIHGTAGSNLARALVSDTMKPGQVFQPMHWSGSFAQNALANAASTQVCDPVSGQPALKSAKVSLTPFNAAWHGFGIGLNPLAGDLQYMAMRPLNIGYAFECADKTIPSQWSAFIAEKLREPAIISSVYGSNPAQYRCIALSEGRLTFAFFASDKPVSASREWLQQQLGKLVNPLEILAGRPALAGEDKGPILCACMNVGRNEISNFISRNSEAVLMSVCEATGAGTGCGSCRIEVQRMINQHQGFAQAAE